MVDALGPMFANGGWINFAKLGGLIVAAFVVPKIISWVIWIRSIR